MGKHAAKRVAKVEGLLPGERVIDACFTMGRTALKMAGHAGAEAWEDQTEAASKGLGGQTMAASVGKHNAIVALTDQRLLWCEVKTALFKPKNVDAAFSLDDVRDITFEKETLAVTFRDGSATAVYAAKGEGADQLIEAFHSVRRPPRSSSS